VGKGEGEGNHYHRYENPTRYENPRQSQIPAGPAVLAKTVCVLRGISLWILRGITMRRHILARCQPIEYVQHGRQLRTGFFEIVRYAAQRPLLARVQAHGCHLRQTKLKRRARSSVTAAAPCRIAKAANVTKDLSRRAIR
jgi:hypothetical protein